MASIKQQRGNSTAILQLDPEIPMDHLTNSDPLWMNTVDHQSVNLDLDFFWFQIKKKSGFGFARRSAKSVLRSTIRFWIHRKEHTLMLYPHPLIHNRTKLSQHKRASWKQLHSKLVNIIRFIWARCENRAKLLRVHFQSPDLSLLQGRPRPFVMAIQFAG